MSLINIGAGLSAMGSAVADYAGTAGLAAQKAELEKQTLTLADQLTTTREHVGRVEAAGIATTAATQREGFETGLEAQREAGASALEGLRSTSAEKIAAKQLAEAVRAHMAEEGNAAIIVTTDADGNPAILDKRTQKLVPITGGTQFGSTQPAPGPAAPSPGGGSPSPASPGGTTPPPVAPAPVYKGDYIKSLPDDAQARFAALSPAVQLQLGPILAGRTSPPESGRAQTDPQLKHVLRLAAFVDPEFNEQTWRERNKMATEFADMSQSKLGGMQASAQKILNHTTDALGAGADLNNNSWLGTTGNYLDNGLVRQAPPGAPGNSPAKKAALTNAQGYKQGVGDEFEKLMAGGPGAQAAKQEAQKLMDEDQDISGLIGGASAVAEMMRGQVQPQLDKYNQIMGTKLSMQDWLGKEANAKYLLIQQMASDIKAGKKVDAQEVRKRIDALSSPTGTGSTGSWNDPTVDDLVKRYRTPQ